MRINFIKEKNKPLHADNIRLSGYGEPIPQTSRVLKPERLNVKFLVW
ncbi:hypothetical protein [Klebsiella phage ST846-OXA48phi9.2]|nr:hypothetical protein [Klebsiella phage ST846-OXA48phi9.2]